MWVTTTKNSYRIEEGLERIFDKSRVIQDEDARDRILSLLSRTYTKLGLHDKALEVAGNISSMFYRVLTLLDIAMQPIPENILGEISDRVERSMEEISNYSHLAVVLARLAEIYSYHGLKVEKVLDRIDSFLDKVLCERKSGEHDLVLARVVSSYAYIGELERALSLVDKIFSLENRVLALTELLERTNNDDKLEEVFTYTLDLIDRIEYPSVDKVLSLIHLVYSAAKVGFSPRVLVERVEEELKYFEGTFSYIIILTQLIEAKTYLGESVGEYLPMLREIGEELDLRSLPDYVIRELIKSYVVAGGFEEAIEYINKIDDSRKKLYALACLYHILASHKKRGDISP